MCSDAARVLLLLVLTAQGAMARDDLGRLLTSPEERRLLDSRQRIAEGAPQRATILHFDGVARSDDGRVVFWVNGSGVAHPRQLEAMGMVPRVEEGGSASLLVLGEDGYLHRLLPGQAWDRAKGGVLEAWEWRPEPPVAPAVFETPPKKKGRTTPDDDQRRVEQGTNLARALRQMNEAGRP